MRLSISARIFGGYLIILALFGGVMGYTFHRMQRLRQNLHLVNSSYLSLTLILAGLHTRQGALLSAMEQWRAGRGATKFLHTQVAIARRYQVRDVHQALAVVKRSYASAVVPRSEEFLRDVDLRLQELMRSLKQHEAAFNQLLGGAAPKRVAGVDQGLPRLMRMERKLATAIQRLRDDLRGQVKAAALQVEVDQQRAFWATLGMVGVALLVALGVTFGSQLILRPLARLVAGVQRIGSGDYSHRVKVKAGNELGDLAREFNNMAGAIDEREQRLLRSERLATAGRIAAHITHEIRNPLSSISLNTELLEEEFSGASEQAVEALGLCQAIRKEVDRLTDFTEEYLRFSRLPRPNLQPEDLHEILTDLLSFTGSELKDRGVQVRQDLSAPDASVQVDENQLRRALLNLLRNAGEAMSASGGTLEVATRSAGDQLEVRISDTGAGIEPEALPKIFEPFFSTKEAGTGLGLALTQQIIQEHGGSIEVESTVGVGTVFVVRLPVEGGAPGS